MVEILHRVKTEGKMDSAKSGMKFPGFTTAELILSVGAVADAALRAKIEQEIFARKSGKSRAFKVPQIVPERQG